MAELPRFSVVVQGERVVDGFFRGMGMRAYDARPAMEEIYLTILDIIQENFDSEGARGGGQPWEPLTFEWLKRKLKRGRDPRILRYTGGLYRGMTSYRHPEQYVRIERNKIVLGSKTIRGKVHQRGAPTVNIPARPYLKFTESDRVAFATEIARHVVGRRRR